MVRRVCVRVRVCCPSRSDSLESETEKIEQWKSPQCVNVTLTSQRKRVNVPKIDSVMKGEKGEN